MSTPLAANPVDAAELADELVRFRIVDSSRLADLLARFPGGGAASLADFLVAEDALTSFQARRAVAGGARWLNIGSYRLIGETTPGTFGPVYTAVHRDRPGEFRLRMFPLRSLWRARQAKQIARALASAPHPSIVPLADADSANGLHYLVWPKVEGIPLGDRVMSEGPLPIAAVVELLVHMTSALHACHLLGVAHGTITPQAIVMENGLPRLLEHGAGAILFENLAADESLLDTLSATVATANVLEYAAPEFVTNPGVPTPEADQYALGAVAYFALTGRLPFPTGSRTDQLAAKLAGPPTPLTEVNEAIPPALGRVIDRMLRPAMGDRFADLSEVRNCLATDAWSDAGSLSAPATLLDLPGSSRSRRKSTRNAGEQESVETPEPLGEVPTLSDREPAAIRQTPPPLPGLAGETPGHMVFDTQPHSITPSSLTSTPIPPASPASPVTDDQSMAKLASLDPFGPGNIPKPAKAADPRTTVGAPIHYHTEAPPDPSSGPRPGLPLPVPEPGEPPVVDTQLWSRLKRKVMFWKPPADIVQVSVFGPPTLTPGQSGKVSVYLHTPTAAKSVHTLCRAFHHDAVLIGTGYVSSEVGRDENVSVHFSISNAGVTKSMLNFVWRGQPHRLVFDIHVPWESPAGPAPGVVSVGLNNVRIGKFEFWLQLLARKG